MAAMAATETRTAVLLQRFHEGELDALSTLLARHLPWIREEVHRQLGPALRRKAETEDFVQDAALNVLRYAPRFVIHDDQHFRALLARIVLNVVKDRNKWFTARRRRMAAERPLPPDSVMDLSHARGASPTPSHAASTAEREAFIRLGIELLGEEDREVIVLREWDRKAFGEIASELGIASDAARMRYARAVRRLGDVVTSLRRRRVGAAIEAAGERGET